MMDDIWITIALMAVSFLAGFVDSVAGGGGLITLPSMLAAGVHPSLILGTNKLQASFGTFAAAMAYIRKGIFKPAAWGFCMLATLVGSVLGAILANLIDANTLRKIIPIAIISIAIYMLVPKKKKYGLDNRVPEKRSQIISGLSLGTYDGILGPGTGSFWTVLMHGFFKQDLVHASAVARNMNLISNLSALITFIALGAIDWHLGLLLGLTNLCGGYLGARSAIRHGERFIKPFFIVTVILIASYLAVQEYVY